MVVATTLNGKITQGDKGGSSWTSKEDSEFLDKIEKQNNLIIMGSKTFEISYNLQHLPVSDKLHIIMTHNKSKYANYQKNGYFEFTDQNPKEIIDNLVMRGYKKGLLLGGSSIYTLFLLNNLVDIIYVTIEPKMFGLGKSVIETLPFEVNLKLCEVKQVNTQGTILLKYKVNKGTIVQKQETPSG